jgi:DNA polymerase-3 subunit delta
MFYILCGPDEFSLREELERIKDGLGDREALASNTTFFEAREVSVSQLMDACMALPFLGSHRLVVIEGLLGRSKGDEGDSEGESEKKPRGDTQKWKQLTEWVGNMPPSTALVLVDGDIRKPNALLKALSPLAQVKEFPPLKGAKLKDWIRNRVKLGGGRMSSSAVEMMASLVGDNLWVLASEIDKLILYTEGRLIDEEDVSEVVSYAREANVFTMVDAIVEGKSSRAASLLHQSLDEGSAAPYLLVMVTRQLRLLVQVKELSGRRCRRSDIKSQLGISKDFVLDKAIEQGRHYSMERLEQVYRKLLETDLSIKRGMLRGELALDLLIAELCA